MTCTHDTRANEAIAAGLADSPEIAAKLTELLDGSTGEDRVYAAALGFVRTSTRAANGEAIPQ